MVWLKLDAGVTNNGVWTREPDGRLWIWLLCAAKRNNPQGQVRYTHAVASEGTGYMVGNRKVRYSRKALREALGRLARDGRVTVPTPAHLRSQLRKHRYFTVTICNWETYQGADAGKVTPTGTLTGMKRARDGHETGTPSRDREGEGESSPPSEESHFKDEIALWNDIAKELGLPAVRKLSHREASSLRAMVSECDGGGHLERAFRTAGEHYAKTDGRKYGLKNLIRASNRGKWIDASREPDRAAKRRDGPRYNFDMKGEWH